MLAQRKKHKTCATSNDVTIFQGLSGSNSLFDICSRGFAVEEDEPLELTHGAIEAVTESGMMQYVLCHVKVGRSLVLEETKQLKGKHLPEGYDSFYVSTDAGRGGLYAVTDASAVTAKYVARFTVGLGCDDSEDDGTKDAYDRPDFFDPTAICAVSVRDKMTGPYSTGELATHKLVPLNEAYDMALTEARSDSVVESRLAAIEHGLASVDAAMRRVNLNFAQVEERIYSLLQDALYDLQRRAGDRLSAILAIEVELRRRRAELLSARERLARVASKSTPSSSSQHLIWAWAAQRKQHSAPMQLDDILAPLRALPAELDVLGAVRVVDGGGRFAKACSQRSYDGEEALKLRSALKDGLAGLSEPEPRQRTSPGRTEEKTVLKHRHEALSLRSMMNRKTRQLHCKLDPQQMFYTSRLVFGEDASALYATLPFAEHPPNTHLVYSSEAQPKTVAAINAELTKSNSNSSLFIAKAGDFCFGAYASDPWRCDGDLFGSPMAFLFSLTLDVKVPYHGAIPPQNTIKRHACIRATNDYISFGDGDLVSCRSSHRHLMIKPTLLVGHKRSGPQRLLL